MIIYAITNKVNGKRYIGQTSKTVRGRWLAHTIAARAGSDRLLHKAIRKHGEGAFSVEEVAHLLPGLTDADLRGLERTIIAQEGTFDWRRGYNRNPGGDGRPTGFASEKRGKPISEAHRAKLRAAWARNPARKAAQAARNKTAMTPEVRAKIATTLKAPAHVAERRARNNTPEHRASLIAGWVKRRAATEQRRVSNG